MTNQDRLPKESKPYWRASIDLPDFPKLEQDLDVDVVIVGGGIVGITSAYLLVNEGKKVALLDAGKLMNGTTGHTTAKVTAQHDLIYDEFIRNFGKSTARLYYDANIDALHFVRKTVEEHQIDCDFSNQDAFIYSTTDEYAQKIRDEARAYQDIGIDGELVDKIPFEIEIKNAIVMKNQAQFNPVKYLAHLVKIIKEKGGQIYENTVAVNVEDGEKQMVLTRDGHRVKGEYVLSCTHFPFYEGLGLYSARMYASRSYILAVKAKESFPGGMYISADKPTRSFRSVNINGEESVLLSGAGHPVGTEKNTMEKYHALAIFGDQVFKQEEILYRWAAQDLETLDKIPYIGEITADRRKVLVATGFRKWGMTNGTAAALLFRNIILDRVSPYRRLYSPARFHVNPSIKKLLQYNYDVVKHLIKGKLEVPHHTIEELEVGEGTAISINGQRKGAYKDEQGNVHIVDTTCTHVGCELEWNDGEKSWDCPCHGSRFSYTGEVLEGPAEKPLQKYDYTMLDNLTSEDSGY